MIRNQINGISMVSGEHTAVVNKAIALQWLRLALSKGPNREGKKYRELFKMIRNQINGISLVSGEHIAVANKAIALQWLRLALSKGPNRVSIF
jgi:hypothetical protein